MSPLSDELANVLQVSSPEEAAATIVDALSEATLTLGIDGSHFADLCDDLSARLDMEAEAAR